LCLSSRCARTACRLREQLSTTALRRNALHYEQSCSGFARAETEDLPELLLKSMSRTYAPKPSYASSTGRNGAESDPVDVIALVERRAVRYFTELPVVKGAVLRGTAVCLAHLVKSRRSRVDWVITSPPTTGCEPTSQINGFAIGSSVALHQWTIRTENK